MVAIRKNCQWESGCKAQEVKLFRHTERLPEWVINSLIEGLDDNRGCHIEDEHDANKEGVTESCKCSGETRREGDDSHDYGPPEFVVFVGDPGGGTRSVGSDVLGHEEAGESAIRHHEAPVIYEEYDIYELLEPMREVSC